MELIVIGIVWILVFHFFFVVCWSIAAAILAKKRGRSPLSWFFLSFFIYGAFGSLFLACSTTLNQGDRRESDTLAKALWAVAAIPVIATLIIVVVFIGKIQDNKLTEKVLNDMKKEQTINQRNIDIIQRDKNISYEEAQKLLDEWNLRK